MGPKDLAQLFSSNYSYPPPLVDLRLTQNERRLAENPRAICDEDHIRLGGRIKRRICDIAGMELCLQKKEEQQREAGRGARPRPRVTEVFYQVK